jgi:hypothetical protein
MIRYPKTLGMKEDFKPIIKTLLRESLMTKEKDHLHRLKED